MLIDIDIVTDIAMDTVMDIAISMVTAMAINLVIAATITGNQAHLGQLLCLAKENQKLPIHVVFVVHCVFYTNWNFQLPNPIVILATNAMASNRHVLVLGGNGKISRLLTVILLKKSWTVTSLIRNPDQIDDLKKISEGLPGDHKILVHDLIKVDSQEKAAAILDEVKPDSVVFSAGPGRGTDQDTIIRIDRDAAIFFIKASVANKSVSHHVQVSYLGARREQAPWWTAEDWEGWKKVNSTFLGPYYEPKTAADEALVTEARKRDGLTAVSVRPGGLTDKDEGGVLLGQTKQARGMTTRASTARVMALVLEKEGVKGHWLDVLDGEEDAAAAVDRYVRDETECAEGEPVLKN
ncbi:nad dependent epimerase dehydratase family [Fusarium sp. NRRL 52700]|nr:nad dependent epimerase dehydratase family [Fusarium sp. NRRL 52700]